MAGNHAIIEVLHFVGAEAGFYRSAVPDALPVVRHLGRSWLGGGAATLVFLAVSWWSARNIITPEGEQASALFRRFRHRRSGAYGGVRGGDRHWSAC
jgi:cell division transport system permease protein